MAARAKDKKMDIVQLTMNGLSKIYLKNLSSCLPGIDTIIQTHTHHHEGIYSFVRSYCYSLYSLSYIIIIIIIIIIQIKNSYG